MNVKPLITSAWSRIGLEESERLLNESLPGAVQFPVPVQIEALGLEGMLDSLRSRKAKVLDIGCGINAPMVEYLRSLGVDAEGVDQRELPSKPYLIQMRLGGTKKLPRQDQYYDLVLSHSFRPFNAGLSSVREKASTPFMGQIRVETGEKDHSEEELKLEAAIAFAEVLRVIRPGGVLIATPQLDKLNNYFGFILGGPDYSVSTQDIPELKHIADMADSRGMSHLFFGPTLKRTILYVK